MKNLLNKQFEQFWRIFIYISEDFNEKSWSSSGHGMTMPMKLAYHIVHSIRYYIGDEKDLTLSTGRKYKYEMERVDESNYLYREEIIELIKITEKNVQEWLKTIALDESNTNYPWTGKDVTSVVLFIIRHSYFHLGEMNGLLNESIAGKAKDSFADNIY